MKTKHLLKQIAATLPLAFLLLAGTEKAMAESAGPTLTYWAAQLSDVSVGISGSGGSTPADVALSITTDQATDTTYIVKTAKGLAWIADVTNNGKVKQETATTTSSSNENSDTNNEYYPSALGFKGCTVKLDDNLSDNKLDLSAYYWNPIGTYKKTAQEKFCSFDGTFDGNHKLITGLKIKVENETNTGSWYDKVAAAGLFGYLSGAHISNLGIQVAAEGIEGNSAHGYSYVGAVAGSSQNKSEISNCFVTGAQNAAIKSTNNVTNGYKFLGGLVGRNSGTIRNCYTDIAVSAQYGEPGVGGIAGYSETAEISNVFATGTVSASDATNDHNYVGGIVGQMAGGTLSNALALNKGGITNSGTSSSNYGSGRITGYSASNVTFTSCYASTKIRINTKVKGAGAENYGSFFDGTSADTDTDLSTLFPTGNEGAWEANTGSNNRSSSSGDNGPNLPKLKSFTNITPLKVSDYLDAPIDLSTTSGTLSLSYSETEGWKQGSSPTPFSGRIKGTGTADLTVTATNSAVLTFADGTALTGTNQKEALTISSGTVALVSEGTATINAASGKNAINIADGATCTVDATHRFLVAGGITTNSSGTLRGLMQWNWSSAPSSEICVYWTGGSATLPYTTDITAYATNPAGTNVTVKVGTDFQKGKPGDSGTAVSTFKYADDDETFISYTDMETGGDKGTSVNPYIVDFSNLTSENGNSNGYTYTAATTTAPLTVTLNSSQSYYSLEGQFTPTPTTLMSDPPSGNLPGCILTFSTVANTGGGTYHLKAANGCKADTLVIPAGANCQLEGSNGLSATAARVEGTLILDAPLTLKRVVDKNASFANPSDISCLLIRNGRVTVNSTLKTMATGEGTYNRAHGTYIRKGTLHIGTTGKMYGYSKYTACYLYGSEGQLTIDSGGILRLAAGSNALIANTAEFPAISWLFKKAPGATITVKKEDNSAFAFTEDDFGTYFDSAIDFAANVEANTDYTLHQATANGTSQQLTGAPGISNQQEVTKIFRTESGLTLYSFVGVPITNPTGNEITLTGNSTYKEGNGTEQTYNNILSGTSIESLKVTGRTGNVILKEVTVTGQLTIEDKGVVTFTPDGTNYIQAIEIEQGGFLWLSSSDGRILKESGNASLPEIKNSGIFKDDTGLFTSVQIPAGDNTYELRVSSSGQTEVAPQSTTPLTADYNITSPQGGHWYSTQSTEYQWEKWDGSQWNPIEGATSATYNAGPGKYCCLLCITLEFTTTRSNTGNTNTVITWLYTTPIEVTNTSDGGDEDDNPGNEVAPPTYYTVTLPAVEGATTDPAAGSYQVESWSSFRFYLSLDPDYDRSVPVVTTSRGETIEPRTSDGAYLLKYVRSDVEVRIDGIVRNTPPVANTTIDAQPVTVRRIGSLLHIVSPCAADIRIYSFSGSLLAAKRLDAPGEITMPAPREASIVSVGNRRFKLTAP